MHPSNFNKLRSTIINDHQFIYVEPLIFSVPKQSRRLPKPPGLTVKS